MNHAQVRDIPVQRPYVEIINPQVRIEETNRKQIPKKLKVASYCRVSTEEEMQLGSLENQIIHYTNFRLFLICSVCCE